MTIPDSITARGRIEHGDRFDPSGLEAAAHFAPFYQGRRVKVRTVYGNGPNAETYERTGTVGKTTGWRPVFLLIHRSTDHGSSDVLGPKDKIVAVQVGRRYVDVA